MILPTGFDTPAVLIDDTIAARNIVAAQRQFDAIGVRLRPHIKTHKLIGMARRQREAGAMGITCQKLSEAEVFIRAGFDDVLITYNLLGAARLARLRALAGLARLTVVADHAHVVEGLGAAFADSAAPLSVLVECDTGGGRCGVQSPEAAAALAGQIARTPGLVFGGLMTYPAPDTHDRVEAFLTAARDLCLLSAGACPVVTSGGTPSMKAFAGSRVVTDYRPGTYIYNDRSLLNRGVVSLADCALRVAATVISRPTPTRAILDAGSKTLSSDLFGQTGYGLVTEYPGAVIVGLSEEHAHVDLTGTAARPEIGETVTILPNHACVVTNLADHVWLHDGTGGPAVKTPVDARGLVW